MKKLFFIFAILIFSYCNATQIYMDLPDGFPKTPPQPGNYVARSITQVFFEKWAQSIENSGKKVELKTLNKNYKGVGMNEFDEFMYFPKISLTNKLSSYDCTLYSGYANKNAYYKLKSPMLYDSENKVCVAIVGWRDYSKSSNSYFTEPISFQEIIYVAGPLPQTKYNPFDLQEVILIPSGIDSKKEKKYIKEVSKLYNKTTNAATNTNELAKSTLNLVGEIILLPLYILLALCG